MAGAAVGIADQGLDPVGGVGAVIGIVVRAEIGRADSSLRPRRKGNFRFGARFAVDTVFEGKRKISPTTRTRTVLIPDIMMLEREAAFKPAR
jgi:hypothetical protein